MVVDKVKQAKEQFYLDKYEHQTRCEDGIITTINQFTGEVTEKDCSFCLKTAKAKELKANGKG